ncbi:MAG: alpha/beta hydrolase [Gammaproteobacteria bacterium]|jgi:hypothetical protein|nr:alpha/beta hydrolase [Gammaproteobacteria bacterium]
MPVSCKDPPLTPLRHLHASDLHGLARLAVDGVAGTSHLVEQLHGTIARTAVPLAPPGRGGTQGITGLVYRSVRGVNSIVGAGIDWVAAPIMARPPGPLPSRIRENWLAALNGVLGDHLAASDNPLAIPMSFRLAGEPLVMQREALAARIQAPTGRLLIAAHGLCMNDLHWLPSNLPGRLGRRLGLTPLYLHYNSGRRIEDNGQELAERLEALVANWPVPVSEIVIVAHSMGGLVARSAQAHAMRAGHRWPRSLRAMAFLGTPHHGSPVERAGHVVDSILGANPYSAPFKRLGAIRSAGITDLRHGLTTSGMPGENFGNVDCFTLAATARGRFGRLSGERYGDGLVPVDSALGRHADPDRALAIPEAHCRVIAGAGHLGLIHHPDTLRQLGRWLR